MQIATASEYPNVKDAPNPDPIANPSGKLCSANPMLVIIPVLSNSLLVSVLEFLILNFLSTAISRIFLVLLVLGQSLISQSSDLMQMII